MGGARPIIINQIHALPFALAKRAPLTSHWARLGKFTVTKPSYFLVFYYQAAATHREENDIYAYASPTMILHLEREKKRIKIHKIFV